MTGAAGRLRRPSLRWVAAEPARALLEMGAFAGSFPWLQFTPRGDGHPVLVLPGFMAGERSTRPLRLFLASRGHRAEPWRLGRNLGPTPEIVAGLDRRLRTLVARHRSRVSLVGWSLGGIYARHLAAEHPDLVRHVITLGSPVRLTDGSTSNADAMFSYLAPHHQDGHPGVDGGAPLPIPATSIYTRTDAIVPWQACLVDPGPEAENIEVVGSHLGLGFNPAAVFVTSDRLAQPDHGWQPFEIPPWLRRLVRPGADPRSATGQD